MKVMITSDSTCDLPPDLISRYNIGIAPLLIIMDEKPYKDGVEITAADVFKYVESGAGMTRTSALNVADYHEYFANWRKECDALIHFNISSSFSSCFHTAQIAAQELDNVYVVDSMNLSTGSGQVVLDAAIMAQNGMPPDQILSELERLIPRVEASFIIGTIKYLYLGGRCSGLAALGANLLKLNPCIEVVGGKMNVGKKYRGSFDKVIMQYVTDRLSGRADIDRRRAFITFPPSLPDDMVRSLEEKVKSLCEFEEVIVCPAGCVISNHCGPTCIGVLFYRK